jgi:hypothetical protein
VRELDAINPSVRGVLLTSPRHNRIQSPISFSLAYFWVWVGRTSTHITALRQVRQGGNVSPLLRAISYPQQLDR